MQAWKCYAVNMRLLYCLIVMSWTFLATPGTTIAATIAVPNRSWEPTGLHHNHRPLLRGFRTARGCDPIVNSNRFRKRGNRIILLNSSSLRRESVAAKTTAVEMVEGCVGDGAPLPDETLRNVIVTGANRGLGFAIADRMLTLGGYRVVLACRSRHEVRNMCVFTDLSCASRLS